MKSFYRPEKRRPALRMLLRILGHCKSYEDIEYLWYIQLDLLSQDECKIFYIHVFCLYKFSLPRDERAYLSFV